MDRRAQGRPEREARRAGREPKVTRRTLAAMVLEPKFWSELRQRGTQLPEWQMATPEERYDAWMESLKPPPAPPESVAPPPPELTPYERAVEQEAARIVRERRIPADAHDLIQGARLDAAFAVQEGDWIRALGAAWGKMDVKG